MKILQYATLALILLGSFSFAQEEKKDDAKKQSKKNNQVLTGKIDSGQITHIDNKNLSTGDIVKVEIIDSTPFYLKAELI